MMQERAQGKTQAQAAAQAGLSERTARKYERAGALPGQLRQPRTHVTRPQPLRRRVDVGRRAVGGRCQAIRLRTLQRHIAAWRTRHGPPQ